MSFGVGQPRPPPIGGTPTGCADNDESVHVMSTAITHRIPPQHLIDLVNPIVRGALASPLHPMMDKALLVLHVRGRRTGRVYDIPVGYVMLDSHLMVLTQHRWRANLRGGANLDVTHHGVRATMHADLDERPESVARTLARVIDLYGPGKAARLLGLGFEHGCPTVDELEEAVREFDLATVTLTRVGE